MPALDDFIAGVRNGTVIPEFGDEAKAAKPNLPADPRVRFRQDLEMALGDAEGLEKDLRYRAELLGKAKTEQLNTNAAVRQAKQDVEGAEAMERSMQEALRTQKKGVMTAGDAEGRKVQFAAYLEEVRRNGVGGIETSDYAAASDRLDAAEAKDRKARAELDALEYQWTALRAVADLTVARINALTKLVG